MSEPPGAEARTHTHTDQPERNQGERREAEHVEIPRALQPRGHDPLLTQEEQARGKEKRETHAPQVTRKTHAAGQPAVADHATIGESEERCDESENEIGRCRVAVERDGAADSAGELQASAWSGQ